MEEIHLNHIDDIIVANYGKNTIQMDVIKIIKNLLLSNSFTFEISNKLFGTDPYENVTKELYIKTINNEFIIAENKTINFIISETSIDKVDNTLEDSKINYYFVILNKEVEDMIDFYFVYMKYIITKCNHNFIKTNCTDILDKIKNTKNNVVILYKSILSSNDMIKLKNNSIKIYFLNVEQLSVLLDSIDDNCNYKKNIQEQLIKSIKFISDNNLTLIDYSYENKKIWNDNYQINNVIILEPCFSENMINNNENKKENKIISLFNHIKYRHEFKEKYLKDLDITSFSGFFCNKRRNLLNESKILVNVHAGLSYKICELFRIYEAIAHKVIIISQNCYKNNLVSLNKYIYFCEDNDIKDCIIRVTQNYNTIYNNFYNENVNKIFENIELKYKSFFLNITEHYI